MKRRSFFKNLFTAIGATVAAPQLAKADTTTTTTTTNKKVKLPVIHPPIPSTKSYVTTLIGGLRTKIEHNLNSTFICADAISSHTLRRSVATVEAIDNNSVWVTVPESFWMRFKGRDYSTVIYVPDFDKILSKPNNTPKYDPEFERKVNEFKHKLLSSECKHIKSDEIAPEQLKSELDTIKKMWPLG
jgi:hypothetical protein